MIVGSKSDIEFSQRILDTLKSFDVKYDLRVASAHKTPKKLIKILEEYESTGTHFIYITVAGRSNALSGFVDANTTFPVIACPPYSNKFSGSDLYSSLRMPSGVCPLVILEPESAALAAIKILALKDLKMKHKIIAHQKHVKNKVEAADTQLQKKLKS